MALLEFVLADGVEARKSIVQRLPVGSDEHCLLSFLVLEQHNYSDAKALAYLESWAEAHPHEPLSRIIMLKLRRLLTASGSDPAALCALIKEQTHLLAFPATRPAEEPEEATDGLALRSALTPEDMAALSSNRLVEDAVARSGPNEGLTARLNGGVYALEFPAVLSAMRGADSKLVSSLLNSGEGLPDIDPAAAVDLLHRALSTCAASERGLQARLFAAVQPSLTLPQLMDLRGKDRSLGEREEFVAAVLRRLAPREGIDFRTDAASLSAYLVEVSAFVEGLPPVFNAIRYVMLHHQLAALRSTAAAAGAAGSYHVGATQQAGKAIFSCPTSPGWVLLNAYLLIPRRNSDICAGAPLFMKPAGDPNDAPPVWVDVAYRSGNQVQALAVPWPSQEQDRAVVDWALGCVFAAPEAVKLSEADAQLAPWAEMVSRRVLERAQAVARLTLGRSPSDVETDAVAAWGNRLEAGGTGGQQLAALANKVALEWSPCMPEYMRWDAPVTLRFAVKQVASVLVRVFEVNTAAYYTERQGQEVGTDIDLDGLVPHETLALEFPPGAPLHVHEVELPLPSLSGPRRGVFVVELVGGGLAARALLRKGALRLLERGSVAGHVLTLLDEDNAPLPAGRASVTLGTRRYCPRPPTPGGPPPSDEVLIPYSGGADRTADLIITLEGEEGGLGGGRWPFATLHRGFVHRAESYQLEAAFCVDREALLRDNGAAPVLIRARLMLHGSTPAPLATLRNTLLTLSCVDGDGSASERLYRNLAFASSAETVVHFAVPPGARCITFQLAAEVEIIADGRMQPLQAAPYCLNLNGIDATPATSNVFLRNVGGAAGFVLYVLGKAGEPLSRVPLDVSLDHRLLRQPVLRKLASDEQGAITLGPLAGFVRVRVSGGEEAGRAPLSAVFDLPVDTAIFSTVVHAVSSSPDPNSAVPGHGAVQCQVPFRPDASPAATRTSNTLTRMDASLKEVRPGPALFHPAPSAGAAAHTEPVIVRDWFSALSYDAPTGFIRVAGLPAGQYELVVKRPFPNCRGPAAPVSIRVLPPLGSEGPPAHPSTRLLEGAAYLACENAALQVRGGSGGGAPSGGLLGAAAPLQIASVTVENGVLVIRVAGGAGGDGGGAAVGPACAADVRVHVFGSCFVPFVDAGMLLARPLCLPGLSRVAWTPPRSRYLARTLGEEQRYVLDRAVLLAAGKVTAGNSLPRPSLLLNPWSLGTVATDTQAALAGTSYDRLADASGGAVCSEGRAMRPMMMAAAAGLDSAAGGSSEATSGMANYDFLSRPAVGRFNLRPVEGEVRIPLAELFSAAPPHAVLSLTVVAVDACSTASSVMALQAPGAVVGTPGPQAPLPPFPLRNLMASAGALDPAAHLVQSMRITPLVAPAAGEGEGESPGTPARSVTVSAVGTRAEAYGSLDRAFGLLSSLSGDPLLAGEFSWLLMWPAMSPAEKAARYSRHACGEVHLFLALRDPVFFETTVVPFLACKRSKSFLDHWVLGNDVAEAYTAPHAFAHLNALEKALLACRVVKPLPAAAPGQGAPAAARRAGIVAHLRDAADSSPPSREERDRVFASALASNALDAGRETSQAALDALRLEAEGRRAASRQAKQLAGGVPPAAAPMPMMAVSLAAPGPAAFPRIGAAVAPMAPRAMRSRVLLRAEGMDGSGGDTASQAERTNHGGPAAARGMGNHAIAAAASFGAASFAAQPPPMSADDADLAERDRARDSQQAFRPLSKTEEYAEAHYYRVRKQALASFEAPNERLIPASAFWADLAEHVAAHVAPAVQRAAQGPSGWSQAVVRAATAASLRSHPFVSPHFPGCFSAGINAMLATLAVLALPLELDSSHPPVPPSITLAQDGASISYAAAPASPLLLFYKDFAEAAAVPPAASGRVLCGQSFFDPSDRYEMSSSGGRQMREKFIPPRELRRHRVYGCLVVVTNVSSEALELDVLLALPQGAMPVSNAALSKTLGVSLSPYTTSRIEYYFYLPCSGVYSHYPVHVSADGVLLASTPAIPVEVSTVSLPSRDTGSWSHVSTHGSLEEVAAFLRGPRAIRRATPLSRILWRCTDAGAWRAILGVLREHQWFDTSVWAYALQHHDAEALRELLSSPEVLAALRDDLVCPAIPALYSALLTLRSEDGVGSGSSAAEDDTTVYSGAYEHLEYAPLVNARTHQLGAKRRILNPAVARQYRSLLAACAVKPALSSEDLMALTYHLLLADRADEAQSVFVRVLPPPGSIAAAAAATAAAVPHPSPSSTESAWSTLQYDYMAAYLELFRGEAEPPLFVSGSAAPAAGTFAPFPIARAVAEAYAAYPVPKWAARFAEIATQLREAGILPSLGRTAPRLGATTAAVAGKIEGGAAGDSLAGVPAELSREAQQSRAAASAPSLEALMEGGSLLVTSANLSGVEVSIFRVDIELLFSSNPFQVAEAEGRLRVGGGSGMASAGQFAFMKPSYQVTVPVVAAGEDAVSLSSPASLTGFSPQLTRVALPAEFARDNLMVSVASLGTPAVLRCTVPYHASRMNVAVSAPDGRLRVTDADSGLPLRKVYVKVYWRSAAEVERDGLGAATASGTFFKDCYTDMRGVADYTSLSTDELSKAAQLAVLVLSEKHGAVVRLVAPPT